MKNSKDLLDVLIDIRYYDSINRFEEIYGEGVSYRKLEQATYVELKSVTIELLKRKIKFKKCRDLDKKADQMILTVKAEMTKEEYEEFVVFNQENKSLFLYDFIVSKIRILEEENNEQSI